MKKTLILDGSNLHLHDLKQIIQGDLNVVVEIDPLAKNHIFESRNTVDMIVAKKLPIYGISTGFGKFKEIYIPHDQMVDLQKNLIVSHASCVGEPLKPSIVLVMMILRLNCLVRGYSGVRMCLLESLQEAINKKLIPKVPCQGSVGASGDLAPLSHLALGLMGLGEVWSEDHYIPAQEAIKKLDFEPIEYLEKEGLAMNNGTQMMAAMNLESLLRAEQVMNAADLAFGLSCFALSCNYSQLFALEKKTTMRVLKRLIGEVQQESDGINPKSIQLSVTTHGIVRETLDEALKTVEREINSTSDNPIIDNEAKTAKSGGNFHGEYMALVADTLCIGMQRLCIFSEVFWRLIQRRTERLVNSELGECGLPMFLTGKGGLLNGYMIPQYTSAALVSENKVLSHPSCIDTVPTSANIEDHVSMGAYSSRKALSLIKNSEYIVAIELMCATQGLEFLKCHLPENIKRCLQFLRQYVPDVKNQDIFMSEYIEVVAELVRSGKIDAFMQQIELI